MLLLPAFESRIMCTSSKIFFFQFLWLLSTFIMKYNQMIKILKEQRTIYVEFMFMKIFTSNVLIFLVNMGSV